MSFMNKPVLSPVKQMYFSSTHISKKGILRQLGTAHVTTQALETSPHPHLTSTSKQQLQLLGITRALDLEELSFTKIITLKTRETRFTMFKKESVVLPSLPSSFPHLHHVIVAQDCYYVYASFLLMRRQLHKHKHKHKHTLEAIRSLSPKRKEL